MLHSIVPLSSLIFHFISALAIVGFFFSVLSVPLPWPGPFCNHIMRGVLTFAGAQARKEILSDSDVPAFLACCLHFKLLAKEDNVCRGILSSVGHSAVRTHSLSCPSFCLRTLWKSFQPSARHFSKFGIVSNSKWCRHEMLSPALIVTRMVPLTSFCPVICSTIAGSCSTV